MLNSEKLISAVVDICSKTLVASPALRDVVASTLGECRKIIREFHSNGTDAKTVCAAQSIAIDRIIDFLYRMYVERRKGRGKAIISKFCVIALGGYGRSELSPESDIDILFLYDSGISNKLKTTVVDAIVYPLWDCGLRVGHSSRDIKEVIADVKSDFILRNSTLDARFVCGNVAIFKKFFSRFNSYCNTQKEKHFDELMRLKRDRHAKFGWTPYLQEPNIKNGIGGLRDFQTMRWKTRLNFGKADIRLLAERSLISVGEYRSLLRAFNFLLRVRNEAHFYFKREADLLDLESQVIIAKNLGFTGGDETEMVEAFMRKVYQSFRAIDSVAKTARKRMGIVLPNDVVANMRHLGTRLPGNRKFEIDGFSFYRGEVKALNQSVFSNDPSMLIKVFALFQKYGAVPSDSLEVLIRDSRKLIDDSTRENPSANEAFLSIIENRGAVFPTLELMHYWGVLGRFVPEFKDITCLVQHEFYHRYTVDTHTLNAISHLDKIFCANQNDGLYYEYHKVLLSCPSPTLLYLAILLHDIGKSDGVRGHAEVSAEIAAKILRRWGVRDSDAAPILFAVKNHLQMARFWQSRDVEDDSSAAKFAAIVKNEENLKYLYVLTFCDASATSEGFWNSYKQGLHSALFTSVMAYFGKRAKGGGSERRASKVLGEVLADERAKGLEDVVREQVELLPKNYFLFHGRNDLIMHAKMIAELRENLKSSDTANMPVIEWRDDPNDSISRLYVVSADCDGLFSLLAGVVTLSGLDILGSKVFTRSDRLTFNAFYVSGVVGGMSANPRVKARFAREVKDAVESGKNLDSRVEKIFESEKSNANILFDVFMRRESGKLVLEIRAKDRVGLLYKIARMIESCGYDIVFARVNTDMGWARDTFHLIARENAVSQSELFAALKDMR